MLYAALLALRFCLVLLPGYIHPDEFFQSPEITAGDIFNVHSVRPWEFQSSNPCRTIIVPYVNSGVSFAVLNIIAKILTSLPLVNSYTLLVAPRLLAAAASLLFDACILRLCKAAAIAPTGPLIVFASSWNLVMLTRTFSNAAEAMLVACALLLVLTGNHSINVRNAAFGGLVACGLFTRFTYLFFCFPLGVFLLYSMCYERRIWKTVFPDVMVLGLLVMMASFLLAAVPFVVVDSAYFAGCSGSPLFFRCILNNVKITPWNSFLYNLDPTNLAKHGLHPRVLHALVNMPLLFGPLYLAYTWELLGPLKSWLPFSLLKRWRGRKHTQQLCAKRGSNAAPTNPVQPRPKFAKRARQRMMQRNFPPAAVVRWVLLGVVTSGLLLISAAPHQEPRFLLPLLVPLAVLYGGAIASNAGAFAVWMFFNGALCVFFGVAHQGGVVRSLHYLNGQMSSTDRPSHHELHVVFFKTFMPPLHLLAESKHRNSSFLDVRDVPLLHEQMTAILNRPASMEGPRSGRRVFLVCPGYLQDGDCRQYVDAALNWYLLWPHVDTDHLQEQLTTGRFDLGVYQLA